MKKQRRSFDNRCEPEQGSQDTETKSANHEKSSFATFKTGWLFFITGLAAALITGWVLFPLALYSEKTQPFNFSHAIHTGPAIMESIGTENSAETCFFCHSFRDDGSFTGIPSLDTCTQCHDPSEPLGESPFEAIFLKEYAAEEKEIPWLVYNRQPDSVYFSHIAHVKMAKVDCTVCHGPHGNSNELPVYRKNRITGYSINIYGTSIMGLKKNTWSRMKMDDCAACHTEKGVERNNACFVCHK